MKTLILLLLPFVSLSQNTYSPVDNNYEVSFYMKPKVTETYSNNISFERAEAVNEDCYLRAEGISTSVLDKDETIAYLNEFAKIEGLSNTTITFESTAKGNMGYLLGYKYMDTPKGNKSVKHLIKIYSKGNSCIILYAMILASSYPKEVQLFFDSIKHKS